MREVFIHDTDLKLALALPHTVHKYLETALRGDSNEQFELL